MSNPTPAEIFQYYKILLTEVLTKHNPAGVRTIEPLLMQFPGKEHQVYKQICMKCGVTPEEPPTTNDFANGIPKRTVISPPSDGRVSQWLANNDFNKYAQQHHFQIMKWDEFIRISSKGRLIELGVIPKHAEPMLKAIYNISDGQPTSSPVAAQPESKSNEKREHDFKLGEICYTKMIKGDEEVWLSARITNLNDDNTFDLLVIDAKYHGVRLEAVNVPRNMLKKSTEKVPTAPPQGQKNGGRPQIQPGTRVRVFGLRSHTKYNGMSGCALLYMPIERRYQIQLDSGDVIAIKQRNVALENVQAIPSEDLEAAKDVALKKLKEAGIVRPAEEASLSDLILKLIGDSSKIDPAKIGGFAAGFLIAQRKIAAGQ